MEASPIDAALTVAVSQAMGLRPAAIRISVRPPLEHQSSRLYDVWASDRHFIAKEFLKPDEFHDSPAREYRALELLAPLDIAPRPAGFRPFTVPPVGPLVVYEFMVGQMWDRRRPQATELAELAEAWLQIHGVDTGSLWMSRGYEGSLDQLEARLWTRFDTYAAWAQAEFPVGQSAADLCLSLVDRRHAVVRELGEHRPSLCFCWSDVRFANVIRRPGGRLGLVDWEDSGLRDPARDLACLMTHPNQEDLLSPDEWQAFLVPYLAARGQLDPQLDRRMHLYLALFPIFLLGTLMHHGIGLAHRGQLAGWTVNGLLPNERLRRYLARGLAWPETDISDWARALAEVEFFPGAQ